jgi:hypothetical protein
VESDRSLPTFQRCLLPPSLGGQSSLLFYCFNKGHFISYVILSRQYPMPDLRLSWLSYSLGSRNLRDLQILRFLSFKILTTYLRRTVNSKVPFTLKIY